MKRLLSLFVSTALALSLCVGVSSAANIPSELSQVCTEQEWDMLKLTNQARLDNGLVPYSIFPSVQSAAGVREQELISLYSHSRPNGSDCFTVLTEAGLSYRSAAENIAAGQASARSVVQSWLNSNEHRANILDPKFTHIGMGYTNQSCTIKTETGTGRIRNGWVQLFLDSDCSITGITLSAENVSCYIGSSLDALNLYVKATCSVHGTCYLPLLAGMYTGFESETTGHKTVTVTYAGQTAQFQVYVSDKMLDTSSADSWAVNWINRANTLVLLSERNRSEFTEDVTRLQFADLAVTLAEQLTGKTIVPVENTAFTDTTEIMILKAKAAGIAGGYKNDATGTFEFRPNNPITREEICVMLAHVVEYVEAQRGPFPGWDQSTELKVSFPDLDKVESWAIKQVALMTNNDIMSGRATDTGALLTPKANTALQEAITLAVKIFDKKG